MSSAPRTIPNALSRRTGHIVKNLSESSPARSPKESPPTIKKKLCRLVNGAVGAEISSEHGNLNAIINDRKGKSTGGSILKKTPSKDSPSPPYPGSPASERRVQFKQHVTVFLMSDDGDVFCSECQQMKTDHENIKPKPRGLRFTFHDNSTVLRREQTQGRDQTQERCDVRVNDDLVDPSEVNFHFTEDHDRGTVLRFSIPLGKEYKPDDIVVKANVSGSRVRLLANRPVSYPDGSMRMEQLSKRFMLPVDVDPYQVTARLDIKGQLTVEAPVLTLSKKEKLKKTPQALSDISNRTNNHS